MTTPEQHIHPTAQRLFDAIKEFTGIDGVIEPGRVAKRLDESPATITNWKARGISKQGALKLNAQLGVNPHWIMTGEGAMRLSEAQPDPSLALLNALDHLHTAINQIDPSLKAAGYSLLHSWVDGRISTDMAVQVILQLQKVRS